MPIREAMITREGQRCSVSESDKVSQWLPTNMSSRLYGLRWRSLVASAINTAPLLISCSLTKLPSMKSKVAPLSVCFPEPRRPSENSKLYYPG